MKTLLLALLLLSSCAFGQKLHVKIISHRIAGQEYSRYVPGIGFNNGNATANCGAYGNNVNCSGAASGHSIYMPAHVVNDYVRDIDMVLLLPDGRKAFVGCQDRLRTAWKRPHLCKNPTADEAEADFSGEKVKLKWGVGIDGKKTKSETFTIYSVKASAESSQQ